MSAGAALSSRMLKRPRVIAHRGASGYEYENSRAAFLRDLDPRILDVDDVQRSGGAAGAIG